jgi:hypothetical protein
MSNIVGSGSRFGIANQTSWDTADAVSASKLLNFTSESIKLAVERIEEDSLLASTAAGSQDIKGSKVSGDFSVVAKPEELGLLFAWALGDETVAEATSYATGAYLHTFTPVSATGTLPALTLFADRKIATKAYPSCKVESLKLDAKSQDYLRATVSVKGKNEETGDFATGLTASTLKAFKFLNGTCTIDGVSNGNITGVTLDYSNKMDDGDFTLGSGMNATEPVHSLREITVNLDTFYDAASEAIREDKVKTGATAAIAFTFQSPSEIATGKPYKFTVTLPNCDITAADANIGGKDKVKVAITAKALAVGSTSPITITYYDMESAEFLTALT